MEQVTDIKDIVTSSSREIAWFVPIDADDSQYLHINLRTIEKDIVLLVSRYECLSGHRHSKLLQELVNRDDEYAELDLDVTNVECDIIAAVKYMHSDQSTLEFDTCSALLYAKTAKYLNIPKLREIMINFAEERLNDTNTGNMISFMTLWDAVAILHLFGDPHQLLLSLDPINYASRTPEIFADATLFSSCRDIYAPCTLAGAVSGIIKHFLREREVIKQVHEEALNDHVTRYAKLEMSTNQFLSRYIGSRLEFISGNKKSVSTSRCTVMRLSATRSACVDVLWDSGEVGQLTLADIGDANLKSCKRTENKENRLINM